MVFDLGSHVAVTCPGWLQQTYGHMLSTYKVEFNKTTCMYVLNKHCWLQWTVHVCQEFGIGGSFFERASTTAIPGTGVHSHRVQNTSNWQRPATAQVSCWHFLIEEGYTSDFLMNVTSSHINQHLTHVSICHWAWSWVCIIITVTIKAKAISVVVSVREP